MHESGRQDTSFLVSMIHLARWSPLLFVDRYKTVLGMFRSDTVTSYWRQHKKKSNLKIDTT